MAEIHNTPTTGGDRRIRLFGLIGYPLTHSFSEKYFTKKFEQEGLTDCRYTLFPISIIHELPGILNTHPELEGLNVTVPYKRQVLSFLHSTNNIAVHKRTGTNLVRRIEYLNLIHACCS